ncbi:hypothetical protein LIER_43905 [Lithospermum erythrorhizon]|uniref:Uncharacterized protein n=1 Tax=Lithospermum erythrorhizon TaxID=34254 RepID=A0AAV3R4Z6_LITER
MDTITDMKIELCAKILKSPSNWNRVSVQDKAPRYFKYMESKLETKCIQLNIPDDRIKTDNGKKKGKKKVV